MLRRDHVYTTRSTDVTGFTLAAKGPHSHKGFTMTSHASIRANWRQVARIDPREAHEIWVARHAQGTEDYLAGTISRDVFAATLYALGFRNADLQGELAYYDQRKRDEDATKHKVAMTTKQAFCCKCKRKLDGRVPLDAEQVTCFTCDNEGGHAL